MAYRIDEFCAAYRISRATVYKLMSEGKLRTVLVAGRRLIPVDAANALMVEGA
jgi:excisionase family DNA binding protein